MRPVFDFGLRPESHAAASSKSSCAMEDEVDDQATPRPPKRPCGVGSTTTSSSGTHVSLAGSERIRSARIARSGRDSTTAPAQLFTLEEVELPPLVFRCMGDGGHYTEPAEVLQMREVMQRYADGKGVLGYDSGTLTALLEGRDRGHCDIGKERLAHPYASAYVGPSRVSCPPPTKCSPLSRVPMR